MAEVIDLKRRRSKEDRIRRARAQRRAQAVASALACGCCPHRCAHCGLPVEEGVQPMPETRFPLCGPCLEEYRAYKRREEGSDQAEAFWHTDQWRAAWRTWLEHMQAKEDFRRSAAFLQLMEECSE